jgi:hypothetical protein
VFPDHHTSLNGYFAYRISNVRGRGSSKSSCLFDYTDLFDRVGKGFNKVGMED